MTRDISNTDDVIDSRDVIARIEELEAERDETPCDCEPGALDEDHCICTDEGKAARWANDNPEDAAELEALSSLAEEAEGYAADWQHGEVLIRDSYFTAYAMELLQDIGDLPKDIPHYIVIDEEATARNIQIDYTSVEFGGVTYWIR